jgi:FMN reductase
MTVAVVVGNPKAASRTLDAATRLATRLGDAPPEIVVDLIELGPELVTGGARVSEAVAAVRNSRAVVMASPTYKASYTGVLKLFLDLFPSAGLQGVVAFPVMLGGAWLHSLAPEVFLKPVLVELGATCPVPGLYLLDSDYEAPDGLAEWIEAARRFL